MTDEHDPNYNMIHPIPSVLERIKTGLAWLASLSLAPLITYAILIALTLSYLDK